MLEKRDCSDDRWCEVAGRHKLAVDLARVALPDADLEVAVPAELYEHYGLTVDGVIAKERSLAYQRVMRELLDAERATVVALRNGGLIDDSVMQRVQRDLDLEAARLDQA